MYYEIEYDSSPIPGAGKFVLKSEKVEAPERDEVRDLFEKMRDIARGSRGSYFNNNAFYDRRAQYENARIFYKQGMFMKDFEDDYEEVAEYDSYYPSYQMMGYKQLRTYFTWRTKVRKGIMERTSLSYAFLYMYELINNIGVDNPLDGFNKLLFFWNDYREYDETVDRYVIKWLKDYYIYYDLPGSFGEFVSANNLDEYYPDLPESEDEFELYLEISKYNIRKSVFYTEDRAELIRECFKFVLDRIKAVFAEHHADFDKTVFWPLRNMPVWTPFAGALFYPCTEQRDRQVIISAKEAYICKMDSWVYNTALATEGGKQLVGYIMKQMEVTLRECVKFKYKITASIHTVNSQAVNGLIYAGVDFDEVIATAVKEFYREATKTVVKVDFAALNRIRAEALITQEKLIVPEEPVGTLQIKEDKPAEVTVSAENMTENEVLRKADEVNISQAIISVTEPDDDNLWNALWNELNNIEKEAVKLSLAGASDIKKFADSHGIMLEVLLDGINEKAMDVIGDSIMDDEFIIYDDYTDDIRKVVD
ncbi:MAG: TerB N-terminal domain-containing protein [Lachnospiraceae bacterium]|nr:TerB N-terminal domain-containing protein [Lachnospiraceae bacterium]